MNFEVVQERHGDSPVQQMPFKRGKRSERHPGQQRDDGDALAYQSQRIVGHVRATQKLEERTSKHYGKIITILEYLFGGRCGSDCRTLMYVQIARHFHFLPGRS